MVAAVGGAVDLAACRPKIHAAGSRKNCHSNPVRLAQGRGKLESDYWGVALPIRIKNRSASLTASDVGNTFATSGAISTGVPFALRPAPRATTVSLEKSYSGRRSSSLNFFLIVHPFFSGRLAGADQPHSVLSLSIRDDEQATLARFAQNDEPGFLDRMVGIGEDQIQRIAKDRRRLVEGNPMLLDIGARLVIVPFKCHEAIMGPPLANTARSGLPQRLHFHAQDPREVLVDGGPVVAAVGGAVDLTAGRSEIYAAWVEVSTAIASRSTLT